MKSIQPVPNITFCGNTAGVLILLKGRVYHKQKSLPFVRLFVGEVKRLEFLLKILQFYA